MLSADGLDQLRRAIKDPVKKKLIAKDETIIGGLVLILSNTDMKVVIEALQLLMSLSAPVENRQFLRESLGMLDQLHILAKDSNPLDHIRELSSQLISRLHSEEPVQHAQQLKTRNYNSNTTSSLKSTKSFNKPFLNAGRFKTITLHIDGLHDKSDMEICRARLLTVKGVVSITFDLAKHRSIIRVRPELSSQVLATAIHESNTMIARQVVRSETGEEALIDLHEAVSDDKENTTLPAYLSDNDSPVKIDDRAIKRFGAKEEEGGAGWLGAAASFLAKSFYW
ncbi:armadillo repeat-containing protein 1-like [Watersipora subatra]|uniref:armadillo repeat-containing protein 1-like n=1 Tax=Watersipora subatra TaxID=2589382 RepID=UPI00355B4761